MNKDVPLDILARLCNNYIEHIITAGKLERDKPNNRYKLRDGVLCHGFIPYPTTKYLIETLAILYKRLFKTLKRSPRFLDIGCGIGNIVLIAHYLGYTADGLEYDSRTYKIAKQVCCRFRSYPKFIKGDMRKFKKYNEYDVLYYYQPMINVPEMIKFSVKLAKEMRPGAYVICHGTSHGFEESKEFQKQEFERELWRKKGKLY